MEFVFKTRRIGDWILSPKPCFLYKNRTVDVQKNNNYINIPPSQTVGLINIKFRLLFLFTWWIRMEFCIKDLHRYLPGKVGKGKD
jgi:hypothetical protein